MIAAGLIREFQYAGTEIERLIIPENVEGIEAFAFYNCKKLKEVSIPESVQYIGEGAFKGCKSLKRARIPKSVSVIGPEAFADSGLEEAVIQAKIVEKKAFWKCFSLKKVILGNNVYLIQEKTFAECKELSDVQFGEQVLLLGNSAFRNCEKLKSVNLPDNIMELGVYCFNGISKLQAELPEHLKDNTAPFLEWYPKKDRDYPNDLSYMTRDAVFEQDAVLAFRRKQVK